MTLMCADMLRCIILLVAIFFFKKPTFISCESQIHTYKLNLDIRKITWGYRAVSGPSVCGSCLKNISTKRQNVQYFGCKKFFYKKCINIKNINITQSFYCSLCYNNQDGGDVENKKLDSYACKRGLKFLHLNINGLFNKIDNFMNIT
jgi:hypothetical protein